MHILQVYHKILSQIKTFSQLLKPQKSTAGRKPKLSDEEIAALYILSFITRSPVLVLAKKLINPSINSYHIFRKERTKRVYRLLRGYLLHRVYLLLLAKLLLGKKIRLIVDGTILPVASTSRARTQKIRRFSGKSFWAKRKRRLYSGHYGRKVEFEELYYGVLVMVVCDTEGRVYDIWFHPGSYHEVKALNLRYKKSGWLRWLLNKFELMGDRGYRGCGYVKVCESKEDKAVRQVVEGVFSWLKRLISMSGWRKGITLLALLYGYAIGYSFFRGSYDEVLYHA